MNKRLKHRPARRPRLKYITVTSSVTAGAVTSTGCVYPAELLRAVARKLRREIRREQYLRVYSGAPGSGQQTLLNCVGAVRGIRCRRGRLEFRMQLAPGEPYGIARLARRFKFNACMRGVAELGIPAGAYALGFPITKLKIACIILEQGGPREKAKSHVSRRAAGARGAAPPRAAPARCSARVALVRAAEASRPLAGHIRRAQGAHHRA